MSLRQVIKDPLYITYNREVKPESITTLVKETIKALIERYDSLVTGAEELRKIPFIDLITGKPFSKPYTGLVSVKRELSRRYEELRQLASTAFPLVLQTDPSVQHLGDYTTIDDIFK